MTKLCCARFKCENRLKISWENSCTVFKCTQMRARVEKLTSWAGTSPLVPVTILLWLDTSSSIDPIIRRMVPIEALIPFFLTEAPCIGRRVERKGSRIHWPIIMIQLLRNNLEQFASNVTHENNGVNPPPLAMMLRSSTRNLERSRKVVLILKVIFLLLVMGPIMVETRVTSMITTSLPEWLAWCLS